MIDGTDGFATSAPLRIAGSSSTVADAPDPERRAAIAPLVERLGLADKVDRLGERLVEEVRRTVLR